MKFFETSQDIAELAQAKFEETGLPQMGVDLKIISITKAKNVLKASKAGATVNYLTKKDAFLIIYEEAFDRLSDEYKERLMARIEELLEDKANLVYDEARREAEVAIFADKCAIDEELTRLSSHIGQLRETLSAKGSIGKRLDFLLQEMNREVNTIGSKANDISITNYVLDMKTELEKIREQIQNLA